MLQVAHGIDPAAPLLRELRAWLEIGTSTVARDVRPGPADPYPSMFLDAHMCEKTRNLAHARPPTRQCTAEMPHG